MDIHATEPDYNSPECNVTIILGKIPYQDLLQTSLWETCTNIIQPLINKTTYNGILRSYQKFAPDYKEIKLPKTIKWKSSAHYKIFEHYQIENRKPKDLYVLKNQIVFPDFKICDEKKIYPDLFFRLDKNLISDKDSRYTVAWLMMAQAKLVENDIQIINKITDQLQELFQGVLIVRKSNRHYRDHLISGGYTNYISDLSPSTILESGNDYTLTEQIKDWDILLKP
jgi:hypothetical protein